MSSRRDVPARARRREQVARAPTCARTGKARLSRPLAERAARDLRRSGSGQETMVAYPCRACGSWHLGHRLDARA